MDLKELLLKEEIVKIKKEGEELFTLKSHKSSRCTVSRNKSIGVDYL